MTGMYSFEWTDEYCFGRYRELEMYLEWWFKSEVVFADARFPSKLVKDDAIRSLSRKLIGFIVKRLRVGNDSDLLGPEEWYESMFPFWFDNIPGICWDKPYVPPGPSEKWMPPFESTRGGMASDS